MRKTQIMIPPRSYLKLPAFRKKNKYNAIKSDGYDSKKESMDARQLKLLEKAGKITNLCFQVPWILQPTFKDNQGKTERSIKLIVDFDYREDGKHIVADSKGFRTKDYIIKRKLFKFKYPEIEFREI